MATSKIKVLSGSVNGSDTRVWIDGEEVTSKVRAINLQLGVDEVNRAELEMAAPILEFEGEAVLTLTDQAQAGELFITSQPHYRDGSGDEQPKRIEEPVRPSPLPPAPHKTGEDGQVDKQFVPGPLTVYVDEERAGTARWAMYAIETGALINRPLEWVEFSISEGQGRDQGQHVIERPERVEVQEERSETGVVIDRTMNIWTRKATA